MKQIKDKISEALVKHNTTLVYRYFPKTTKELREIIYKLIQERGLSCSLNDIDVSEIDDMSGLFTEKNTNSLHEFTGDISKWDVSNVKDMSLMFARSNFNSDISGWDVSNVKDMSFMFSNDKDFNNDISGWDVSNVKNFTRMFAKTRITYDLSHWNVNKKANVRSMFIYSPLEGKELEWFKK